MACPAPAEALPATLADRVSGALWGMHIADALAMPAHWYYGGPGQIARDYGGPIRGYVQPPMNLAGSIMNKSNTGGAGRGGFQGSVIGDIICHGKKPYWAPGKSHHYHCTLQKGENTLEMQLTRLVYGGITGNQATFSADVLRQQYVDFMTTPGSHNDCYASTCHRMFFANRANGTPLEQCPDNDAHNVDTLDGLVMALPVALATINLPAAESTEQVASCVAVTRRSRECQRYAATLGEALQRIVKGEGLAGVVEDLAGQSLADTVRRPDPMTACYLPSGWPVVLHLTYKYGGDFEAAVLANVNAGGENVHKGMLLGALLGAAHGASRIPPALKEGLVDSAGIAADIDAFVAAVCVALPPAEGALL